MTRFHNLMSEGTINGVKLKNRVFMSAMGTNLAEPDGSISDKTIAYYEARAKGGAGVIVPGVVCVDYPYGKTISNQIRLDDIKYATGVQNLAEAVHRYDSKLILQLHHAGCQTHRKTTEGHQPVGPSVFPDSSGAMCRAMDAAEVQKIIWKFIDSATYAQVGTADGVCLHAGHGYLISQFLSPAINKRKDDYGGSTENRLRILKEIIKGIRAACGPGFIIGTRLGALDLLNNGFGLEEGVLIAEAVEQAGADYIDVTYGALDPLGMTLAIETQQKAEGNRIEYAETIKKAVNIPIVLAGKMRDPNMCDGFIADKRLDFVALGRQLIADPDWVNKAREGRLGEIRKCLSCNDGCVGRLFPSGEIRCAINPLAGKERGFRNIEPGPTKKKVLVIGGGPAGIQCAITAAQRGHDVTLIESSSKLGGQLKLASATPNKAVISDFIQWGIGELARYSVTVTLGQEVTMEVVKSSDPDMVILATGSKPMALKIPGIENTIGAWSVLDQFTELPENEVIAVIGGGIVGCEVAHLLAEKKNKVTIFEMLNNYASGLESIHKLELKTLFKAYAIDIKTNTRVMEIQTNTVIFTNQSGENQELNADRIILAVGQVPARNNLAENITDELNMPARYIGDANHIGKIFDAVTAGFYAGYDI